MTALLLFASLAVVAVGLALANFGLIVGAQLDNQPYHTPWWMSLGRIVVAGIGILGGLAIALTGVVAAVNNVLALAGLLT